MASSFKSNSSARSTARYCSKGLIYYAVSSVANLSSTLSRTINKEVISSSRYRHYPGRKISHPPPFSVLRFLLCEQYRKIRKSGIPRPEAVLKFNKVKLRAFQDVNTPADYEAEWCNIDALSEERKKEREREREKRRGKQTRIFPRRRS